MADKFSNIDDLTSQGRRVVAITPSDAVDLIDVPKALWVGVAGDIAGTGASGTDGVAFTYKNVPVGAGANIVPVYSDGTNWRIG